MLSEDKRDAIERVINTEFPEQWDIPDSIWPALEEYEPFRKWAEEGTAQGYLHCACFVMGAIKMERHTAIPGEAGGSYNVHLGPERSERIRNLVNWSPCIDAMVKGGATCSIYDPNTKELSTWSSSGEKKTRKVRMDWESAARQVKYDGAGTMKADSLRVKYHRDSKKQPVFYIATKDGRTAFKVPEFGRPGSPL